MSADIRKGIYTDEDDPTLLHRLLLNAIFEDHERVRNISFIGSLTKAKLPLSHYLLYLATLHHIYEPLEAALDASKDHRIVEPLYFANDLARLKAVEADLKYYIGEQHWRTWVLAVSTPATQKWRERLQELITTGKEHALVSHAYSRYLGDLAGGQVLLKRILKMYNLPEQDMDSVAKGAEFYVFRNVPDLVYFKKLYRVTLNNVGMSLCDQERVEILQEARLSFDLNYQILMGVQRLADSNVFPTPLAVSLPVEAKACSDGVNVDAAAPAMKADPTCPLRALPVDPNITGSVMVIGLAVLGYAVGSVRG